MIYRVALFNHSESSRGFDYFGSGAEARIRLADWRRSQGSDFDSGRSGIVSKSVPRTKRQLIALLDAWAGHPDNG